MQNIFEKIKTSLSEYKVFCFDVIDSTNNFIKTLPKGKNFVISRSQSAGRGRLDREFFSDFGGLYFSFEPQITDDFEITHLTIATGLAICAGIEKLCGICTGLKWVNDVLAREDGRKLCGILCQGTFFGEQKRFFIGVGINVINALPQNLRSVAASLSEYKTGIDFENLASQLCSFIVLEFENILINENLIELYRKKCLTIGNNIRARVGDKIILGTAVDIDKTGGLVVKFGSSKTELLLFGEAEILK